MRSADTTAEAYERQLGRRMAADGIRRRHPDYDDRQVVRALVWLFHGEALARGAWPDLEPCPP